MRQSVVSIYILIQVKLEWEVMVSIGVFNATFNNSLVAVSFIGAGNRSTRKKPPACRKSLTNFSTPGHELDSNSQL